MPNLTKIDPMPVKMITRVFTSGILIPQQGPEAFAFLQWLAEHVTYKFNPILTTMHIEGDPEMFVILRMPGTYRDPANEDWTKQAVQSINDKLKQYD